MSETIRIDSGRGTIEARWDDVPETAAALLLVGGADGGFDGPAEALYPTLVEDAAERGWAALRLDFRIHRFPNDVDEGVHDMMAGIGWLGERGVERIGLVGHSFGGAVVIRAGAMAPAVRSVVTLATQTAGALVVEELTPTPLLLIHGADDIRLSPRCSEQIYGLAGKPKELVIIPGATHSLRQAREEVRRRVLEWFERTL